jgi:hypothetical protein
MVDLAKPDNFRKVKHGIYGHKERERIMKRIKSDIIKE